jgi:hypothetical protein
MTSHLTHIISSSTFWQHLRGGEEGKTTKMLGLVHFSFLSNKKKKLLREMRMDRRNALAGEQTNDKGGHYPKPKPKNKQNKNGRLLVVKL